MKFNILEVKIGKIQISDNNIIDRGIQKHLKQLN